MELSIYQVIKLGPSCFYLILSLWWY